MKIKQKLFATIVTFAVIPILILSAIFLYNNRKTTETLFREGLKVTIESQIAILEKFHHDELIDVKIISLLPECIRLLTNAESTPETDINTLRRLLINRVEENSYLENIIILDSSFSSVSAYTYKDVDREQIKEIVLNSEFTDNILYINVYTGDSQDETTKKIYAVYKITNGTSVAGYILKSYRLDFFDTLRTSMAHWSASTFYLIDANNKIITAGTSDSNRTEFVSDTNDRSDYHEKANAITFVRSYTGSFDYKYNNQNYITMYSMPSFVDWKLLLSVNLDERLKTEEFVALLLIMIPIIGFTSILFLNYIFGRLIIRPIKSISSALNSIIGSGDYSIRIATLNDDEIANVVESVNYLLDSVETSYNQKLAERDEFKDKLEIDGLSGLFNKITTTEKIVNILENAQPGDSHALMLIDFDNFKEMNDTLGHAYGDTVIKNFGNELKSVFNEKDILGRIGGDEFVVFISDNLDEKYIRIKATQICKIADKLYENDNKSAKISASVGIAISPKNGDSFDELYKNADVAMYMAKTTGKNAFTIYNTSMNLNYKSLRNINIDAHANRNNSKELSLEKVIEIIYSHDNFELAAWQILKNVSVYCHFQRGYIFEISPDGNYFSNTVEWCDDGTSSLKSKLQNVPVDKYAKIWDKVYYENFICIDNIYEISDLEEREAMLNQNIKSMVNYAITEHGVLRGLIGFDVCYEERNLSQENFDELYRLCSVLGTALLKHRDSAKLKENNMELNRLLSTEEISTYIIEKNSYNILYIKDDFTNVTSSNPIGKTCHSVFMGINEPCPNCPVANIPYDTGHFTSIVHNYELERDVFVHANNIKWLNGENAALLKIEYIDKLEIVKEDSDGQI